VDYAFRLFFRLGSNAVAPSFAGFFKRRVIYILRHAQFSSDFSSFQISKMPDISVKRLRNPSQKGSTFLFVRLYIKREKSVLRV